MSDLYRKDYKRRNDYGGSNSKDFSRNRSSRGDNKDPFSKNRQQNVEKAPAPPQPTILIKAREAERASSPGSVVSGGVIIASSSTPSKKDAESSGPYLQVKASVPELSAPPHMACPVPLLKRDMTGLLDTCLEFLSDQTDFLVVGCLGLKGVGKSTLMSLLAQPDAHINEKLLFGQHVSDDVGGQGGQGGNQPPTAAAAAVLTSGIDLYITSNRIILLDCHPTSTGQESNTQMQSLELAAFLFSVCHVVLFVQNYSIDPDSIRFVQTAEMLKPSTSTAIGETMVEYLPHLVFVHNLAHDCEFQISTFKQMQESYIKCFVHSRLQIQTGFGMTSGDVSPVMDTTSCGSPVNLFLLPAATDPLPGEQLDTGHKGHPPFEHLFRHFRNQILSTPRTPISHALLTEKNWFLYAGKVWEGIQKSSFFKEYHRLITNT